ncbi:MULTISPECIES: DNA replication/repair protein RecF [Holospora]|uniref:DNA replication and repair protein RecF n=2 Tax=Holospora TaxID=44747 RepID=A0A061JHN7_9PROT|nr:MULTISPECIES: AAA family ATPase [Holospora]ETZ04967.1 DNA replication and repair protein RecF [Holospora undulata HU1]GAJ46646.1 DNA replication and repair protein RecF [Holospora elegans E1]
MHQFVISKFRSYHNAVLEFPQGVVCLVGDNGAGKTNLLEALSLFAPGKGLKGTNASNWHHKGDLEASWTLKLSLQSPTGPLVLETFESKGKRCITMNGVRLKHQLEISQWISIHWITPAIDRMWNQGWWARRKYFDRIVFTLYPAYGKYLQSYQLAVQERNRALKSQASSFIFDALEEIMAHNSVKIYKIRQEALKMLGIFLQLFPSFPLLSLETHGEFESLMACLTFNEKDLPHQESELKKYWKTVRTKEFHKGTTMFGPHQCQWAVTHPNSQEIASCSTGEQKSMLLSLVLAWSKAIKHFHPKEFHFLLLDEVSAHLDKMHRESLWKALSELDMCVWMTGVHQEVFSGVLAKAWVRIKQLEEQSTLFIKRP